MSFESSSFDTESFSQNSWRFFIGSLVAIIIRAKVNIVTKFSAKVKV